jgi:hypothetical protein
MRETVYCARSWAVAPVIVTPVFVIQSVRNVWAPGSPLQNRVVRSYVCPGASVTVSNGLLACVPSK